MTIHSFVDKTPEQVAAQDPEIKRSEKLIEDIAAETKVTKATEVPRNFQPNNLNELKPDPLFNDANIIFEDPYKGLDSKQLKARMATVLDRGVALDRMTVPLPPHLHGEWVPNDKMEILYKQSLGFWVDTEYASARALHDGQKGGVSRIGDTIFMVCRKEVRDAVDEIRAELYEANNSKTKPQKENRDFANLVKEEKAIETPVQDKSTAISVDKEGIRSAMLATN